MYGAGGALLPIYIHTYGDTTLVAVLWVQIEDQFHAKDAILTSAMSAVR